MTKTKRTAFEWFTTASLIKTNSIPAIAERMHIEMPDGTDEERAAWAENFLKKHPQHRSAPLPPPDIKDYTPRQMLDWANTGETKVAPNLRVTWKAAPPHPAMLRPFDLDNSGNDDE